MKRYDLPRGSYVTKQEIIEEYDLTGKLTFLGYIIHLNEEEYLVAHYSKNEYFEMKGWAPTPGKAIRFKTLAYAEKKLQSLDKGDIAILFETNDKFLVIFGPEPEAQ